jgi:SAM-dependent methyltransferase
MNTAGPLARRGGAATGPGRAQPYSRAFFRDVSGGARRSAQEIVPLVLDLVQPGSVIDVGCATGTWLALFRAHGVADILGVDGDYVERDRLEIPPEAFRSCDLTQPLALDRRFDLVVSLEVAEHLPGRCAGQFVASLTRLGPVVLFSAAIPHQGGTHHVNGQWQDYWAARFRERGYVAVDCLRWRVWTNDCVEYWYAQNAILYVEAAHLASHPVLRAEAVRSAGMPLAVVHPRRYLEVIALLNWPRKVVPPAIRGRLVRLFDRLQRPGSTR